MNEEYVTLRTERLSLCIGQTLGQLSELLNNLGMLTKQQTYHSLLDITNALALNVNELYYKGNKPND